MKRAWFLIPVLMIVLAACGQPAVQPTPDASALATLVQQGVEQTLAAASPTAVSTSTITAEPTATQPPTPTAIPIKRLALLSSETGSMYLYTIGSDGSNMQRVSSNTNVEGTYDYSPDEQWIAYETYLEADGNSEIYVMKSDGSDARKLVVHAQNDFRPVWSPDGSRILFHSDLGDRIREVFLVNADGTGLINLSNNGKLNLDARWSPDGSRISYESSYLSSDEDIANLDIQSSSVILVQDVQSGAAITLPTPDGMDNVSSAQWSPDGTKIAFNCGGEIEVSAEDSDYSMVQGICVAAADGSSVELLYSAKTSINVGKPNFKPYPAWSPDGSQIAFIGLMPDGETSEIFRMQADGSQIEQITKSATDLKTNPSWSKDGLMLNFLTQKGSILNRVFVVYAVNLDGSHLTELFRRGRYTPMPEWLD